MTTSPMTGVAPHETLSASADWTLSCAWHDRGRLTFEGVPLARRGPLTAFFDGALFDMAEWRAELGLRADTDSGAQILLSAYERHGEAVVGRLRGSFVAAIHDERTNRALVVRDPLGAQPLFYATVGRTITFASSVRALLRLPGVSRDLNRTALADQLCNRWPDREETFFAAVRRVPPGWHATLVDGTCALGRYWNPVTGRIEWLTERESARFEEHLDRAVRRCLEVGPTGIFLSGGFDSVSVAAVAADEARRRGFDTPRALSLGFPAPECDERLVQTSVARTLALPLHLVDFRDAVGDRGLFARGLELNRHLEAPLLNNWMPAYQALARHASLDGVRALLTGSGGDEWLGVTPYLAADLIRRGDVGGLIRLARMWHRSFQQGWMSVLRGTLWTYGTRPLAGALLDRVAPGPWQRSRRRRLTAGDPAWAAPDPALRRAQLARAGSNLAESNPADGFYARESETFLDHALMSWEFEEQHAIGQPLGLRYLHPYWDVDLLSHIYRTPPEILNRGGRSKGQVRETVARRFPALGFERQRKVTALGFFTDTLAREAPALAASVDGFEALGSLGIVEAAGARAFVHETFASRQTPLVLSRAWNLINVETWARHQTC